MSDSKLRELERRWRETKSVDDEAAYLRERVRVGDLTQERLELAAYCGHEGARCVVNAVGGVPPEPWPDGLRRFGSHAVLEYGCLVARATLRADAPGAVWRALRATRHWLNNPSEAAASEARSAGREAEVVANELAEDGTLANLPAVLVYNLAWDAATGGGTQRSLAVTAQGALEAAAQFRVDYQVRAELAQWALRRTGERATACSEVD